MRKYIRKQPDDIRFMFNLIAHRYNLMNSLITFGYDKYWRRTLLNQTRLPNNGRVLDIGTGTGDLSLKIVSDNTDIMCVGADFSENMLNVARARRNADSVCWLAADSLSLSFQNNSFDVVMSAFLLRNVGNVTSALKEQYRVLNKG